MSVITSASPTPTPTDHHHPWALLRTSVAHYRANLRMEDRYVVDEPVVFPSGASLCFPPEQSTNKTEKTEKRGPGDPMDDA